MIDISVPANLYTFCSEFVHVLREICAHFHLKMCTNIFNLRGTQTRGRYSLLFIPIKGQFAPKRETLNFVAMVSELYSKGGIKPPKSLSQI